MYGPNQFQESSGKSSNFVLSMAHGCLSPDAKIKKNIAPNMVIAEDRKNIISHRALVFLITNGLYQYDHFRFCQFVK